MLRLLLGMLTRTFVRPWDAEYSSPNDTAVPGKRADVMVGLRHALQAADGALGLHTAMVLWDLEAFYDNVDVPTLIRQCKRWHFHCRCWPWPSSAIWPRAAYGVGKH